MLAIPPSLQTKLDGRATTLCHCWRLARRDGGVSGYTDHDRDLSFNGVVFRAATGLAASQTESTIGLAAGGGEAAGALSDNGMTESDLLGGRYDGASVETWLVDWSDVADRVLLDVATIGEVRRGENAFVAELRSGAHVFDQQIGRAFQRHCAADLGDVRCGVDLSGSQFATTGVALSFEGGVLTAELAQSFVSGFFAGGRLTFTSGANAGAKLTVKSHRAEAARGFISFWTAPGDVVSAGDTFHIVAGFDKSPASCQSKFDNIVNFRGFPHLPGNDRVIAYPSTLAPVMDGGSFFR